ncbi:hypothetical protein [Cupriavidus sp. DF5525]|uniref:hypothetical protein n=1 Tax=Cupriavidus sp. DF5525 TaxID=3160989 RepID=UPI0032E0383E
MNAPQRPSMLTPASSADWPAGAIPESWVDSLFARMSGMYGSKFADLWRGTDLPSVRRLWGKELASLSRDELRRGSDALLGRPFPPTLPEFVSLCRPGINVDAALYEAAQQLRLRAEGKDEWTNPAIYWAAMKVGEFDMLNLSHGALLKRFGAALDTVLRQDQIPDVPERLVALPAPGRGRASPERVEAAMREVRATAKEPGNKRWAERIVARVKAGEKIALGVLRMAQTALGLRSGS